MPQLPLRFTLMSLLLLVCAPGLVAGLDEGRFQGAWLQNGVKWTKAPPDINPHLEVGGADILYFGRDQTFAVIHCFVNRVPKQYETISHGDGQMVYRGTWEAGGDGITVKYRLVSSTVKIKGEALPGPIQQATIKVPHKILSFGRKHFRKSPGLDDSAAEVLSGTPQP